MPDPLSLNPIRKTLETFAEEVGGELVSDPSGWPAPSFSVQWFQKDIQRGINIRPKDGEPVYALTAYATTVKRGQHKLGRQAPLPDLPADSDAMEALYAGKTAAQAMMEKSFTLEGAPAS